jgi:hypothetical protein
MSFTVFSILGRLEPPQTKKYIGKTFGEMVSGVFVSSDAPRAVLSSDKREIWQNGRRSKELNEPMFTLTVTDRMGRSAKEGVLLDGDTFKSVYVFKFEGMINILFPTEDINLHMDRLAMWRIASHETFGGWNVSSSSVLSRGWREMRN